MTRRMTMRSRMLAVATGLAADRIFGEPPSDMHPVARFGGAMSRLESKLWRDDRVSGVKYALLGISAALSAGLALDAVARLTCSSGSGLPITRSRSVPQVASVAVATWVATAGKELGAAASEIGNYLLAGDLTSARGVLPALVGRDPSTLGVSEISRAVVESVAENTVDAVVAPAMWAAAGGAPGALAYRATNTLDAMVGYRNPRYLAFGWASARFDDWANWLPARATAALVVVVRPRSAAAVWRAVRTQAPTHPSPNSGVAEAAFAAVLGVTLGGVNRYDGIEEIRPELGSGPPPGPSDIERSVRLSRDVMLLLMAFMAAPAGLSAMRRAVSR